MVKQARKVVFTVIDPNKSGTFERVLRKILIEKLASQQKLNNL